MSDIDKNDAERDRFDKTERYDPLAKSEADIKNEELARKNDIAIKPRSPFGEKIENFFYHYKWHTVVALFLVIAIVICSFQMCKKTSYDMYVMYAGSTNVSMLSDGEETSKYEKLLDATKRFVPDFDGDGEKHISLLNIYLLSDEEIRELEAQGPDKMPNYTQQAENGTLFRDTLLYGDYHICILSYHLFEEWTKNEENCPFVPIRDYLPEGAKVSTGTEPAPENDAFVLPNEYGVYLRSTPLADNPGYSLLGDDTVICLRMYSEISENFNKKQAKAHYENSEAVLRLMLADRAHQ